MNRAIDIEASINRQDTGALMAQMKRAKELLNLDYGRAVQFGAWAVAGALAASVRVAPKHRAIEAVSQAISFRDGSIVRGNLAFRVTSDKGGESKQYTVYAPSKAEAKKLPQVRIGMRGLAKASWGWPQRKLGSSTGAFGSVTVRARSKAERVQAVAKNLKGDNPYVQIDNRLGYIEDAMIGGPRRIDDVMERAAKKMVHVINGKIAKRMGAT